MLYTTYLTPTENWATTAKSFSAPDRNAVTSTYNLGTYFNFEYCEYKTLPEFAIDMRSRQNSIAIYGKPSSEAELEAMMGEAVRRKTENFPYRDDHTLHEFDIDGWEIPEHLARGVELTNTEDMGNLIDALLVNEGFDILASASKVITLSSSCWDLTKLNCHIHVEFDEPVRIEAMREFAIALNKVQGRSVFDSAPYKAVQPQFFASPKCIGFEDRLANSRIFYRKGANEQLSTKEFQQLIHTTLKKADWNPSTDKNTLPPIGSTWLLTIQNHINDENGINDPCHRAAAQLVQSMGKQYVLTNMHDLSKQMFDATWATLTKGFFERGQSEKDKKTYDIARFRQYLESATQKDFGDGVDRMRSQIEEAIKDAEGGNLTKLTSMPVAQALTQLKTKHYGLFLPYENHITKAKLLKGPQLNRLMQGSKQTEEVSGATSLISDGFNENELIDTVINQYDMLMDHQGTRYASVPGNGDGGYRMMRVDGSLMDVFYCDGLDISGNMVGQNFGKKVLSKLLGREKKAINSTFEECLMGGRIVAEDATVGSPTWLNLGKQDDGKFKSAVISSSGVRMMTHRDSKVKWIHGTPSLHVATNEQIEKRFGPDADLTEYLMSTIVQFINPLDEDPRYVMMWLCSVFANKSLSYLAEIVGPASTGKSTAANLLKDLIDPSHGAFGQMINNTHFAGVNDNFIADIEQRYVTILDNISKLTTKDQDTLCTIATGLRHSERILYTQAQMERIVQRPLILTALSSVVTRPDLRTRVITIALDNAPFDLKFVDSWTKEKPFLTAAAMQLTSKVMKLYENVTEVPPGIGSRDVLLACVTSAMDNLNHVEYQKVLANKFEDAEDAWENAKFNSMFNAYLNDEGKGKDYLDITTRGLAQRLRSWGFANAGKERSGHTVDVAFLPETGRGLGWEIAKNVDAISRAGDWSFTGRDKKGNGIMYKFERKTKQSLDSLF